ncbi:hypothetical protein SAMN05443144_106157 [Fodinibius roseus]|uniref:CAAX protease self-immunity n=1 Tax=Fodinibius roseus TaxID=1194090 RepID=A0A1M4ZWJ4_9BACT|nr:hypothetical protein [Fodinibius roseus]SHF22324.1 hypothetical protein SAMN05443144_106157 [Fodinibius roseus]
MGEDIQNKQVRNSNFSDSPTSSTQIFLVVVILFLIWTGTTYLLEGRILTFNRPEAVDDRLVYTLIANVLIGVIGTIITLCYFVQKVDVKLKRFGFRDTRRTLIGVITGTILGFFIFVLQGPPTLEPVVLANVFSQVFVVSTAEVMVCWVVFGGAIEWISRDFPTAVMAIFVVLSSAVIFGLYHYAHSPPFNTLSMVLLLTGIGVATGIFYFLVREIYGTIIFHNFFAMYGIADALAKTGQIEYFSEPQYPLFFTAFGTVLVLVYLERKFLRNKCL